LRYGTDLEGQYTMIVSESEYVSYRIGVKALLLLRAPLRDVIRVVLMRVKLVRPGQNPEEHDKRQR